MSWITSLWKKWPLNLFIATGSNFNDYSLLNSELDIEVSGFSPGLLHASSQFIQGRIALIKNMQTSKFDYLVDKHFDIEILERMLLFWGKVAVWKPDRTFLFDNFSVKKWGPNSSPDVIQITRQKKKVNLKVGKDVVIFYSDCGFLFGKILLGPIARLWGKLHSLERCWIEINKNMMLSNNKIAVPINSSNEVVQALSQDLMSSNPVIKISADGGLAQSRDNKIDNLILRIEDRTENLLKTFNFIWNSILEEVGVETVLDKKERKLSSEVSAENQIPKLINENQHRFRLDGLKQINKMFRKNYNVNILRLSDEEIVQVDTGLGNPSKQSERDAGMRAAREGSYESRS